MCTLSVVRSASTVVLLFAASACADVQTPEGALEAFLEDAQRGRWAQAAARVSEDGMEYLRARYAALHGPEAAKEADAGALLEAIELRVEQAPTSVVVVSPIGRRVTLRATVEEGRSAEFPMVEEDGDWKVDLGRALQAPDGERGIDRAVSK
jgi:hypothetical protein